MHGHPYHFFGNISKIQLKEMKMECKMSDQDRLSRVVAGIILITFAMITGNFVGWLGIIPLVTGIVGWCPLYGPLGINTCATEQDSHGDAHH